MSIEHCHLSLQCSVGCICSTVLCFPRFMLILVPVYDYGHLVRILGGLIVKLCFVAFFYVHRFVGTFCFYLHFLLDSKDFSGTVVIIP